MLGRAPGRRRPVWLGVVAGGVLAIGWLGLYRVAADYPLNRNPVLRRAGAVLEVLAFACAAGTVAAWSQLRTDHCGRIVGTARGRWAVHRPIGSPPTDRPADADVAAGRVGDRMAVLDPTGA